MTTNAHGMNSSNKSLLKNHIKSLRNIIERHVQRYSKPIKTSNLKKKEAPSVMAQTLFIENHNSSFRFDESGVDRNNASTGNDILALNIQSKSDDDTYIGNEVHFVDACTMWKFPNWLVDRLDCAKFIENADNSSVDEIRRFLLHQLKVTSTDLLLYATVRREFLRSILVIELDNVARLLEVCSSMEIDVSFKNRFFSSMEPCLNSLEVESKPYDSSFNDLAQIIDDIFLIITPNVNFKDLDLYEYNSMYASYLVPGNALQLTEMCCGGIVDNNWISLEGKYNAMVMVTPHVYDDPNGIQLGILRSKKYRVEAYFDVDRGHYSAFDKHIKSMVPLLCRNNVKLEHLVFNFFSKDEHYVEEKNVFLMNGPQVKGNVTFARIYHALLKTIAL